MVSRAIRGILSLQLSSHDLGFVQEDSEHKDDEDAPPEEDLYEKAEKDFWDIINQEKKKIPNATTDFEKADGGKVSKEMICYVALQNQC